jgi:hypothetical protein
MLVWRRGVPFRCGLRQVRHITPYLPNKIPSIWSAKSDGPSVSVAEQYKERADLFLAGSLPPFVEQGETSAATAARLSGYLVEALAQAATLAPMGAIPRTVLRSLSAADFIRKYGLQGLGGLYLSQDILQSAQLIYSFSQKLNVSHPVTITNTNDRDAPESEEKRRGITMRELVRG